MGVGLPTVSKMTYRLLARSWVRQTPAATDHRCKYLQLTADGHRMVEELGADADLAVEHVFAKLNGEERQQLMRLLLKLV
jgi:DNA-binding MarR family transcriptional regulator